MMPEVLEQVQRRGVIAILRRLPEAAVAPVVDALLQGGVTGIEITLDNDHALHTIAWLRSTFGARIQVGAGTVLTAAGLRDAVAAGAQYLLSPHLDVDLLECAADLGCPMVPGVLTPSEVALSKQHGAEVLKLFPAGALGSAYLKDLLGPFHGTAFIPTGGVSDRNAGEFIRAGAVALGAGSSLVTAADVEEGRWACITAKAQALVDTVAAARGAR